LTDSVTLFTYFYIATVSVFGFGALFFALRLTRITGLFRGWVLIIVASAFIMLQAIVAFVELVVFLPESKLAMVIELAGVPFFTFTSFGIATSIVLFSAMYDLFRAFKRQK